MSTSRTILFLALTLLLWNCQEDSNNNGLSQQDEVGTDVATTPDAATSNTLSAPTPDKDGETALQASAATGQIKEACQLISEEWVRNSFPKFRDGDIKLISRTSPDGNASACQCMYSSEAGSRAFVIGYRIAAGNMQYLQSILNQGLKKDDARDIPPYQEVYNLGQKAAFSKHNGNLAWVTEKGLYIYMYLYPQSAATMKPHFNMLYEVAPQIEALANQYSG
ncbi:MAG: hypothetical protein AAF806_21195 [Bacteroidota bacterium]